MKQNIRYSGTEYSIMDPNTLPEKELELYNAIKAKYKVGFEPLTVQDHRLNILRYTDLEQILDGRDPLKNPEEFPLWNRVWEAAIVLAEYLAGQKPAPGTSLLELGAGLGATGLIAAAAGFDVTLSDYEEHILDFLKINTAASQLNGVEFLLLDWMNPPELPQYDVIIGTEIIFREEFFEPLLALFTKALKPGGTIFLAHDERRRSIKPFFSLAEKNFSIGVSRRRLKSLEEDKYILLARLKKKE